ncbi:hypothetical protein [Megasphaera cerevisiae]|nr:hypothetical protein [Megasphaera cerevisiae]
MTATATRASCASFSYRFRAAESRKGPQNKAVPRASAYISGKSTLYQR